MMYPYMTLDDGSEIVHSEMLADNTVIVYVEKADEKDGFHYARCILPACEWIDVSGFDEKELSRYQSVIENNAHLMSC